MTQALEEKLATLHKNLLMTPKKTGNKQAREKTQAEILELEKQLRDQWHHNVTNNITNQEG